MEADYGAYTGKIRLGAGCECCGGKYFCCPKPCCGSRVESKVDLEIVWGETPCGSFEWLDKESPPKIDIYLGMRKTKIDGEWSYEPMVRIGPSGEGWTPPVA